MTSHAHEGHCEKKILEKKARDLPIEVLEILIMPTQVRFSTFVSFFCLEIYSMIIHHVDQCPLPLANFGAVFKDSSSEVR